MKSNEEENMKTFKVEKLSLGDKKQEMGDQIVFGSLNDLQEARKQVENGNDIYVKTPDGLITALPFRMITQKIYDGTIRMSAIDTDDTKEKEKKC